MTRLNSSGLISAKGAKIEVNAELTQMSMGPSSFSMRATAASIWTGVGDIDRHHHRGCSRYSHLSRGRSQPDLATSQQRDRVPSLGELAYHCPANTAARAGHGDHATMYLPIAHA